MHSDHIEKRVLEVAKYTIKTSSTVRETAKIFGVSKSTIHKDLSERLLKINRSMYEEVQRILTNNFNEKHIRGGEATKEKYLKVS